MTNVPSSGQSSVVQVNVTETDDIKPVSARVKVVHPASVSEFEKFPLAAGLFGTVKVRFWVWAVRLADSNNAKVPANNRVRHFLAIKTPIK